MLSRSATVAFEGARHEGVRGHGQAKGVGRLRARVSLRAPLRSARLLVRQSAVVEDESDSAEITQEASKLERLETLLTKASTSPVDVKDIVRFYPYDLDEFQIEATDLLINGSSVVVSAPTGSGKTLVGETAILTALAQGKKAIYTTPLKALSNQKLREFQQIFGKRRCGLKTGDVDINGDADVMIMTTEILRNMLYSSAAGGRDDERLQEVSVVVLDEVHYLADRSRGTVWEETIIYCPSRIQLLCLSATVGNPEDLTGWIEEVHGPCKTVISNYRPVPLTWQYSMKPSRMYPGMGPLMNFKGTKLHHDLYPFTREGIKERSEWDTGNGGQSRNYAKESERIARRRFVPHVETTVQQLIASDMIPAVWFIFSRKGCDQSVEFLVQAGANLVTRAEQNEIDIALNEFSEKNKSAVRSSMVEPLRRGIASHHAGLLPAWKGLVEKLFQRGLIKVVFATETLAAGVNMPARCSVLSALSKRDDQGPRLLTSNEFMQMAGRAGRRGFDKVGHVVCCQSPFEGPDEAFELVLAPPENLKSQFSISYGMVLNLLQGRTLEQVQGIVERSFGNYLGGKARAVRERELRRCDDQIKKLKAQIEQDDGDDEGAAEWKKFMKLDERLKEEKRLLKILKRQIAESQASEIRETVQSAIERSDNPVIVAIDIGNNVRKLREERKSTTIALFENDTLKMEGQDLAGEWRLEDVNGDNAPSLDDLFGYSDDDSSEGDFMQSFDEDGFENDSTARFSRGVIAAAIFEAIPPAKQLEGNVISKPYPMGEFTALGSDGVWYRIYSDRIKSIGLGGSDMSLTSLKDAGAPPSSSSLRWVRASGGGVWKSDTSKRAFSAAQALPSSIESFVPFEDAPESAEYINAQKMQILKTQEEIYDMEGIAALRRTAKQQKKRESKLKALKEQRAKIEQRIKEYSAAGWDEFLRVVDILVETGALESETLKLLEFGEICADLRGENELWLGMALSSPQITNLDAISLAGFAGALCMDNRPTTCFYGPSEELSTILQDLEPKMNDLLYLQMSSRIDVPVGLSFEIAALVESWASGTSWEQIRRDTTLDEGDLARILRRTAELLAQIPRAPHLPECMKAAAKKANDIVNRPPISDLS